MMGYTSDREYPLGLIPNCGAGADALAISMHGLSACRHPSMPVDSGGDLDQRFEIDLRATQGGSSDRRKGHPPT
ncbi:hypothetical protein JQ607_18120 [Bradyrhizobium liaoningense]|uniref:hypothetical protein n=1 Tax=Bradyrhizobium liaoningense TaxID=43992 RepID=UPI001BA9F2D8|nr:hypothetical protein [Bradyrhizobium liaoningense]MBR0842119.1 hypothetical protein [Bradyrhizobium liaoningense]MBR0858129.1 hypothetical protein [Bradyrhizobium liaoningense]